MQVEFRAAPQDTPGAVQLNPESSAPLPLLSREHKSKPADRGEEDDINYANLKATPHRRLTAKSVYLEEWGKLFTGLQKRLLSDKE